MDHGNGNGATHSHAAPTTAPQTIDGRLQALEDAHAEDHARLERIGLHLNTHWKPLVAQLDAMAEQVQELARLVEGLQAEFVDRLPQDPRERLKGGRPTRPRKADGTIAWEGVTGEIAPALRLLNIQAKHLAAYLDVSLRTVQFWMANRVEPEKENLAALITWLDTVRDNGHEDNRKLQLAAWRAFDERERRNRLLKTQNSDPAEAK